MYQYLLDHAKDNVWCNPEQDNQLIFCAHRVTKSVGELNRFKLMSRKRDLPTQGKRYHVFQVGQVTPGIVGLLSINPNWVIEKWVKFSDAINTLRLFSNIYTTEGVELPRYKSYYMFTNDRCLIFAIEQDVNFPIVYNSDRIYTRFYTNAYFQSTRADLQTEYIHSQGKDVKNIQEILDLQAVCDSYRALPGFVFCYKNGLIIDRIDLVNVNVNDSVEFIYDSSVKRVVTFTINELRIFDSLLDNKYKYLLHHSDGSNDTIDYQDDIDIHILHNTAVDRYKGYYYNRNQPNSHRMVTHRDYAVCVDYVEFVASALNTDISNVPLDILQMKVQVKIRDAGYHRPLIFDNNRIFELYKLPEPKRLNAMIGLDATVPEWKAENLENSFYTKIMKSKLSDITLDDIQKGYGYNSLSKITGDTPTKTILRSGRQSVDLPYCLHYNCTAYEYDANGKMLGYYPHQVGTDYECINNNARLVEVISGEGSNRPDVRFGTDNIPLPIYDNYRVYSCHYYNGELDNNWMDITGSNLYNVVNNTLVWNNLDFNQYLMVRTDRKFLAYDINLIPVAGTMYFTFSELETRNNIEDNHILPVPLGELDIFLNGKSLIRGLDYIVKFPKVYIINKTHLIQPAGSSLQSIHIRFTGFCNSDLSLDTIEDYGFIQHGVFSNNNRYDIRDDKVLRITLNGNLKHREDLVFSELHDGISVTNPINGQPYQIKDIVVPLKELVNENTYSLRNKSIAIDHRVQDYMTIKLPQPDRNAPSAIPQRYPVVSPFICHLINDMASQQINNNIIMNAISDNDVLDVCRPYEFLLDFDPINPDNELNDNYVIIYPHQLNSTIDLNIHQFKFITKVIRLYANGLVELSPFVTFST
jgi:hypothetical protein